MDDGGDHEEPADAPTPAAPGRLRVEYLTGEGIIVGTPRPRLSWWLPTGSARQHAYWIDIDGVTSPRIPGSSAVLVPWPADGLSSRGPVMWRVRVETDQGISAWSSPARFEVGLLEAADWQAAWIGPVEVERPLPGQRPAYLLAHEFELDRITPARLHATAHGIYEMFLNGRRVGDVELAPGSTSYASRVLVQTYDVEPYLGVGRNRWEVLLSDGWYRGTMGFNQEADCFGDDVAFLGQLEVGSTTIVTGPDWTWGRSSIVAADLMVGQSTDLRIEPRADNPVRVNDLGLDHLAISPSPPVRRVEEIRPMAVTRLSSGAEVVDLGQNINGWVRLDDLGPAGTEITLTHAEVVDRSGDLDRSNLRVERDGKDIDAGMVDRAISAGRDGEVFEPRHTTHGFRHVRVEGHPGSVDGSVTGVVVHTDLVRTGWFSCSDERIDRLHEAAVWSFRGNACDVPTDCPTRERAGWTGDYQLFVDSATFLYDVAGFSVKWLLDVVAEQRDDGAILGISPNPGLRRGNDDPGSVWNLIQGSAGWGDAITIVPWHLWSTYGDAEVLERCYPAMIRWMEFGLASARSGRHPSRSDRPAGAHEEYLWDTGFHWGEWHEPGFDALDMSYWEQDRGPVATAYLHRSATITAAVARLLGDDTEADRFEQVASATLEAWRLEYIGPDGRLVPDTQANHVRALAFGLVPESLRAPTAQRLVDLVRAAGTHLTTGFLSTPDLLPVLADTGHLDVAYELLFQDTPPAWLPMIDRGGTTVFEAWDGIRDDGTPVDSLNHYSKGAVISFLHRHVAGIQQAPGSSGFERIRIAPRPGGGLTWARATHDCARGRIESSWRHLGDSVEVQVTVPPGSTAEVLLPDGARHHQGRGQATYVSSIAATGERREEVP